MKVKMMQNFQEVKGAKGCKWSSLKAQGMGSPLYHSLLKLGESHFSQYWPSGVIRIGLPVWKWKSWKIFRTKVAWRDGNGPGWVSMALKNPLLPLCFYLLLESLPEPRHFEMRRGCELSRYIVALLLCWFLQWVQHGERRYLVRFLDLQSLISGLHGSECCSFKHHIVTMDQIYYSPRRGLHHPWRE